MQVILLFPHAFWGDQLDMFGHVAEMREERGEAFLFYSYTHISGGALLVGLCSGGQGWAEGGELSCLGIYPVLAAAATALG